MSIFQVWATRTFATELLTFDISCSNFDSLGNISILGLSIVYDIK
jgi:hypothetical protein